jgi:hypothetical protein
MEAPLTISCPDFWTSLVLKSILEERGVLVQPPQEQVFLTLTVSGPRDVIKTTVGELQGKYRRSSPIYIEAMEPVPSAPASTNSAYAPAAEVPAAEVPAAEVPAAEVPAAEVPAAEVPAAIDPAAEAPAAEVPAAIDPAAEAPAAEVPAAEVPAAEVPAAIDPAAAPTLPSPAPQRCASDMGGGSQCRLPAVPGGTKCAIHISTREDWHRELPQP